MVEGTSNGIWNRFLRVDLTRQKGELFSLPPEYFPLYLGGKSLGTRLMLDQQLYNVEPLASENKIFMLCGPLSGSMIPGAGKMISLTRSPLTKLYMDSAHGGRMSHNLKAAGYDGLVLEGKSPAPVYLYIDHEKVEIRSAADLWGKGCFETERLLRERYGQEAAIGSIGPAGENLVLYANVTYDFYHQSGRCGLGAVMGSKNLKALVVCGDLPVPVADPESVGLLVDEAMQAGKADQNIAYRIRYGTMSTFDLTHKLGMTPVRNFSEGTTERFEDIKAESLRRKYVVKDLACYTCPMACGKASKFSYKGREYILGGPEYESISLLGPNLEMSDPDFFYLTWLCDDLGMDTMSTGVTIACAMEALEKGLLSSADLELSLSWGSAEQTAALIEEIAYRRGIGNIMADGVLSLAKHFSIEPLAMHVKGLELAAYDPRGSFGYALAMAVADRGGCHRRARPLYQEMKEPGTFHSYNGKPEMIVEHENERSFFHSLVICDFIPPVWPLKMPDYAHLVQLVTGIPLSRQSAIDVGARAFAQNRIFNLKCGLTRDGDTLPQRFFDEGMTRGPAASVTLNRASFAGMIDAYYHLRGWNKEGRPLRDTLAGLKIEDVII